MLKNNIFKIVAKIGKSVALGVVDSVPVVSNIKANMTHESGGKGKVDFIRLATAIATVIIIIAFILGKINIENVERLLKLI